MADELGAVANLFYEMGTLKRSKRTGWWMAGVKDPETVAEHAWRVSVPPTPTSSKCLLQGIEYREQGFVHAQRWIDNSRARLKTASAAALADKLLESGGLDWLRSALGES